MYYLCTKSEIVKIGTYTQQLMNIFALTNEEVCFCQLLAVGRTQPEAYGIAFYNQLLTGNSPATSAARLIASKENISKLTAALKANFNGNVKAKEKKERKKINITTKEGQLGELNELYNATEDGKQRQEILKQVADLQQLKHEQTGEEERRVNYYLPMSCKLCPYNPEKKGG